MIIKPKITKNEIKLRNYDNFNSLPDDLFVTAANKAADIIRQYYEIDWESALKSVMKIRSSLNKEKLEKFDNILNKIFKKEG